MKSFLTNKRSQAIFGIVIFAISIGAITKTVISYPPEGCMKEAHESTFGNEKKSSLFNLRSSKLILNSHIQSNQIILLV